MAPEDARALCKTYFAYRALSAVKTTRFGCLAVRLDIAPVIYDVNHIQVPGEVRPDVVLEFADEIFSDRPFRHVLTSPFSGAAVEAHLAQAGFKSDATLQGLLKGDLLGPAPAEFDIRPVIGEDDWKHLDRLVRADHVETDERAKTEHMTEEVTRQMQQVRRLDVGEVQFFFAWVAGEPVAFFSSWAGVDGVGMVEDLFTLPSHRKQGIARALIHHCVADARAKGAGPVLIGSFPDDTPKDLYKAMGFEPTCLTRNWLKLLPA